PKPGEPPKPGDPAKPAEPAKPPENAPLTPEQGKERKGRDHGSPGIPPSPKREWVSIKDAQTELEHLKAYLKKKDADNQDIIASLDSLAKAYHNLRSDVEEPAVVPANPKTIED